jgi:cysteinyl-tRNA synthetase
LNELLKSDDKPSDKLATILDFDKVFGLNFVSLLEKSKIIEKIPSDVQNLLKERETARNSKNWKKSDELRDKIKELGYEVKDTKERQNTTKM